MSSPARRRRVAGFTLIELLIVILIIGILVAIGVPAYLKYVASANDRDAQAALRTAYQAAIVGDTEVSSNRFPVAATIVNDIKTDEPAASIATGFCLTTVAQAQPKQVIVDTASTASQIVLCSKSASGAIWKLSGPLTGDPTMTDGSSVPLTLGATDITDALRAGGSSGDGLTNDSSTGVWEGTTNYITNGGFELALSPWSEANSNLPSVPTTIVQTTTDSKFGRGCGKLTVNGLGGADQGSYTFDHEFSVPSDAAATISGWVKAKAGQSIFVRGTRDLTSGGYQWNTTYDVVSTFTATGSWQRVTVNVPAYSGSDTTQYMAVRFGLHTAGLQVGDWLELDGAQLELKPLATPYVDTSTTTGSRTAGSALVPAAVLNDQTGWAAFRVRVNWDQAHAPGGGSNYWERLMSWGQEAPPRTSLDLYYSESAKQWVIDGYNNGVFTGSVSSAVQNLVSGSELTVIAQWTPAMLAISVNGSTLASHVRSSAPPLPGATFMVGAANSGGGGYWCDCDFRWAAFGTGTLTDSDAATINSWGANDPKRASFPASAQATMVWDGASTAGSLK